MDGIVQQEEVDEHQDTFLEIHPDNRFQILRRNPRMLANMAENIHIDKYNTGCPKRVIVRAMHFNPNGAGLLDVA